MEKIKLILSEYVSDKDDLFSNVEMVLNIIKGTPFESIVRPLIVDCLPVDLLTAQRLSEFSGSASSKSLASVIVTPRTSGGGKKARENERLLQIVRTPSSSPFGLETLRAPRTWQLREKVNSPLKQLIARLEEILAYFNSLD